MKMGSFKKRTLVVMLAMCFLVGCEVRKYIDVSEQEPYRSVLGYKFKSNIDLLAIGVTFDQNYKGDADYVFLMARPGISGPQVKFEKTLPKGAEFKVVGVLKSDRIFGSRLLYVVKYPEDHSLEKYPLVIKIFDDIESPNKGLNLEEFIFFGRSP